MGRIKLRYVETVIFLYNKDGFHLFLKDLFLF